MLRPICNLDDLLILSNSSFKDYLLKLEMVLKKLSIAVNAWHMDTGSPDKEFKILRNKVEMNDILKVKAPKTRKAQQTTSVYWYELSAINDERR
jgi:hypothetical protein